MRFFLAFLFLASGNPGCDPIVDVEEHVSHRNDTKEVVLPDKLNKSTKATEGAEKARFSQPVHSPEEKDEERKSSFHTVSMDSLELHVDHLVTFLDKAQQNGKSAVDLAVVLEASFSFAKLRSAEPGDAVSENVAALVAVGIVVGHSKLGWLVGFRPDPSTREQIQRHGHTVRLRGRRDLAQHFCVSAALAAISNETLSNLIGQIKEQTDAGPSGSGFSFADLMADQAGSRLGNLASSNPQSAKRIQRALAGNHTSAEYMPAIEGLPEGISAERLTTDFGGINGEGYRDQIEEIERRLNRCRLFTQPSRQPVPGQ
jgi:hypothetical protein